MDYFEIQCRAQALVEEALATATEQPAEALGLDQRCGSVWLGEDFLATDQRRLLDYYGGFEYIDQEHIITLGSWTFYSIEADRVLGAFEYVEEQS